MLLHAVVMASGALGAGCPGAGGQGPGSLGTAPDDVVVTKTAIHDNSIALSGMSVLDVTALPRAVPR